MSLSPLFLVFFSLFFTPTSGITVGFRARTRKNDEAKHEVIIDSDGQALHPLHDDHPHYQKVQSISLLLF